MTLILIMIMIIDDINTEGAHEQRSRGQPYMHRKRVRTVDPQIVLQC